MNPRSLPLSDSPTGKSGLDMRYLQWYYLLIGKIRRGNYVFLAWTGDHGPRHVHIYRDKRLVLKWDLEHSVAMKGKATQQILRLIAELQEEGRL
jgi:hypothetical protein